MKTSEFISVIKSAKDKPLRFTTAAGLRVPSGYHVTEVMNVHVDSVDCGGRPSSFSRTVVQLWNGVDTTLDAGSDPLTSEKVKAIFDRVDSVQPLLQNEDIYFEWGDPSTPTAMYAVSAFNVDDRYVDIELFVPSTQCKPATDLGLDCCQPIDAVQQSAKVCCG